MGHRYHWNDGWFFQRLDFGIVRILKFPSASVDFDAPASEALVIADIPPHEWASIVAHMSAHGENSEGFEAAERFHRRGVHEGVHA